MLSLDPEGDPYRICLVLDQLALRGGQSEHLLQLSRNPFYADDLWRSRPNIDVSSALAEYKLKHVQQCRASLVKCVKDYPWIFPRLFQELNIDHIPKSVWGKSPPTDRDQFECELYVHSAKDLWNTPEATSFLVEVVESAKVTPTRKKAQTDATLPSHGPITLDEARHVLLSGVPSVINLIPREYTTLPTSSSDPLPPPDNVPSYDLNPPGSHQGAAYPTPFEAAGGFDTPPEDGTPNPRSPEDDQREIREAQELQGLQGFFRRFIPWIGSGPVPEQMDTDTDAINARAAQLGIPEELMAERSRRALELLGGGDAPEGESANATGATTVDSEPEPEQSDQHNDERDATNPSGPAPSTRHQPAQPDLIYDDDRNQHWLAGQGMSQLRDFCARHGTDENAWHHHTTDAAATDDDDDERGSSSSSSIVTEYARRVVQLRQPRFILDYALAQGAGREVKELVQREVERLRLRLR